MIHCGYCDAPVAYLERGYQIIGPGGRYVACCDTWCLVRYVERLQQQFDDQIAAESGQRRLPTTPGGRR